MNLANTFIYCWKHHVLPKVKYDKDTACMAIGNFRFFYSQSSSLDSCKDQIKVIIVHPDGGELIIINQIYGCHGRSPDWVCWKHGKWDQALNDAVILMEDANIKKQKELDDIRETALRLETEKRNAKLKKFEDLF
jgi:hypothetical protein